MTVAEQEFSIVPDPPENAPETLAGGLRADRHPPRIRKMQRQIISAEFPHGEVRQAELAEALLSRLAPIIENEVPPGISAGTHQLGSCLFRYCCFAKERFSRFRAPKPLIGIVLKGRKELWLGETCQLFRPGSVFALPSGPVFDVVNVPDKRGGIYESLLVELSHLPEPLLRHPQPAAPSVQSGKFRVRLTPMLVEAIAHAASTLSGSTEASALAEYRLAEILTLLHGQPAASALFSPSLRERIALMVQADPARRWTASIIAKEAGLGESTLRRKLAEQNTSLREIILSVRMETAQQILANGKGNVLQASLAAGYTSRSHFARRFRTAFRESPKRFRRSAQPKR